MSHVYCAYCGKEFSRKEHLERHIPTHTNVKPYRCRACYMDFARRDLLQRHYATYHEPQPMEGPPGGAPTIAGKTPIACQTCAQAKTGCDKRVPCGRCTEKGLPCAARYARRSSKALKRAASAAGLNSHLSVPPPLPTQPSPTINPVFMEMGHRPMDHPPIDHGPSPGMHGMMPEMTMNMDPGWQPTSFAGSARANSSPPHFSPDGIGLMPISNEFTHGLAESGYQDVMVDWAGAPMEASMEVGMYAREHALMSHEVPVFTRQSAMSSTPSAERLGSSHGGSTHTRSTSITSSGEFDQTLKPDGTVQEFDAVIEAEAAWPLARCNPLKFSAACPRTAIVHLESLEQKSRHDGTWCALEKQMSQVDWNADDLATVVQMGPSTRDHLLAVTQTFLHKALEIHRGGMGQTSNRHNFSGMVTYLVLPPSNILEYFLRSYCRSLQFFYSLVSTGCVDPNEMLRQSPQTYQASALLVLLMIAQGASAVPTAEARALSAGLIETCRISLFDIIEKNVEMCADQTALRCALLFTLLGSWSGDKWLMDISMGQRGMYLSMLTHAGMLQPQPSMIPTFQGSTDTELHWRTWLHREEQNRLVYNWVMMDQELSLFHDTAPILAISDLRSPLPSPECLWMASSAQQWRAAMQSIYGFTANLSPQLLADQSPSLTPSLYELFQDFLHDNLARRQPHVAPQQLRLLLHPLQSLLCHLRQMLSCFSDVLPKTMTRDSTAKRLEEVQDLLRKWYDLAMDQYGANPDCAVSKTNLVLYHLITLNAVTSFSEIERLARRENFKGSYDDHWDLNLRHQSCIYQRDDAVFHCGQVLRLVNSMPTDRRPIWWSVAVYRAGLILWAESLSRLDPNFRKGGDASAVPIAIDLITRDDAKYLWGEDAVPVLTSSSHGQVDLDQPVGVLAYAIELVDTGVSSRLSDGIKRKLEEMNRNWARS